MKDSKFIIKENRMIADRTYLMRLWGDTDGIRPGQFVEIRLEGYFLRRPISVCDCSGRILTVVYKTVGSGTEFMSRMVPGTELDIITCLGNGYDLEKAGEKPVLIGGGAGVPPMYFAAKKLAERGIAAHVILGFNTEKEVFFGDEFRALGCDVTVTTADGSFGKKGFVTDALCDIEYTYFYACGPKPMLKALNAASSTSGEFSFEERMGCGFGACMGCSIMTKNGSRRVCKDGPVFKKEEIIWED